jgi:Ca-activated chloride channel family protein
MIACELRIDRPIVSADRENRAYGWVRLTAPRSERLAPRRPVAVALVLDRSGSMEGQKLAYAKEAARAVLGQLTARDRFAIVVYDHEVQVLSSLRDATPEHLADALRGLEAVGPGGSTNLAEGWLRGCEQVAIAAEGETLARCFLLTDGLANAGLTEPAALAHHAGELRRRGVVTTTFGVGADFAERLLQSMAEAGGGSFFFIESPQSIAPVLARAMGEALEVTVRDASIQLETKACKVEAISPGRLRVEGPHVHLDLGDLVSGQVVDALFALRCSPRATGVPVQMALRVVSRDGPLTSLVEGQLGRAPEAAARAVPTDAAVGELVARAWAAQARLDALRLNEHGDYAGAVRELKRIARRIRNELPTVPAAQGVATLLLADTYTHGVHMSDLDRKGRHFASPAVLSSRDVDGFARRP